MAKRSDHEPLKTERTRTSSTWIALAVGVIFLVLLIDFIAQNEKKVPIHFLGAYGRVSEALALVGAAVAGAVLVLAVSAARILQLRIEGRRHNRAVAKQQKAAAVEADRPVQAPAASPAPAALPTDPPAAGSAAPLVGEAQPVQPENKS